MCGGGGVHGSTVYLGDYCVRTPSWRVVLFRWSSVLYRGIMSMVLHLRIFIWTCLPAHSLINAKLNTYTITHSLTHSPSHSHPHMQLHLSDTPHEDLPGLEDLGVTPTPVEDVAIATVRRYRNFYTYNKPVDDVAPIRRAWMNSRMTACISAGLSITLYLYNCRIFQCLDSVYHRLRVVNGWLTSWRPPCASLPLNRDGQGESAPGGGQEREPV